MKTTSFGVTCNSLSNVDGIDARRCGHTRSLCCSSRFQSPSSSYFKAVGCFSLTTGHSLSRAV
jgi:hypothetical protein